jgi:hypothetical protein
MATASSLADLGLGRCDPDPPMTGVDERRSSWSLISRTGSRALRPGTALAGSASDNPQQPVEGGTVKVQLKVSVPVGCRFIGPRARDHSDRSRSGA